MNVSQRNGMVWHGMVWWIQFCFFDFCCTLQHTAIDALDEFRGNFDSLGKTR